MIVPSANLLGIAFGVIGSQIVDWHKYQGVTQDAYYRDKPTWALAPVKVRSSVQAVSQSQVVQQGLDTAKLYKMLYAEISVSAINQGGMPDRFNFDNATWEVTGQVSNWHNQDGWTAFMVVRL